MKHLGDAPPNPGRRRFLRAAAALLLGGVPADALWWEPRWLEVSRYTIPLPGLPAALDGLRMAQLSDLHCGPYTAPEFINHAVARCNQLQPDLVALTGDFVYRSAQYAAPCVRELQALRAPLGIFAVPGNHDIFRGRDEVMDAVSRAGIHDLTNRSICVRPGLRLAGIDDMRFGRPNLERALRDCRPEEGLVLLSHEPFILPQLAEQRHAALCIAGHTHGGQVCVPLIRRNWLPGLLGSPYISGWYARGEARLYVNRGIGMVDLPMRFLCRPEITLFTLRASN